MKLIVGLGNPGAEYTSTRHNVGFMVVDRLSSKHGAGATPRARFKAATTEVVIAGEKCLLLKPTTYMNLSGQCVGEAIAFYKADVGADLLVVVDDLYLPTGAVRLRPGGGTGGHNGLTDIQRALGTEAYARLRIGVGMLPGGGKPAHMDQADYVLSRFSAEEHAALEGGLAKAVQGAEAWASRGLAQAMNSVNAPEPKPGEGKKQTGGE
ncbi:MAG: aminoacyl-tRNA hydrolase [Planctomycetota bacterium]|nr:aminoacyl-tRNA hydrolase [Planctomycetota bacterium]